MFERAHRRPLLPLLCAASLLCGTVLLPAMVLFPAMGHAQLRGALPDGEPVEDTGEPIDPAEPEVEVDEDGEVQVDTGLDDEIADDQTEEDADGRLRPSQPGEARRERARGDVQGRARRAPPVGTARADGSVSTRASESATAVQAGTRRTDVPGPYDPVGIRLGPLRVVSTVEQSVGVSSNADFTAGGEGGRFSDTRFALDAATDLSLHELRLSIAGAYRAFDTSENLPTLDASAAFRYDVRRGTSVTVGAGYRLFTESATDDALLGLARTPNGRPLVHEGEAYVEAARTGGRLFGSLRGSVGRELYEDVEFTDGTRLSQYDREATILNGRLRLGYEHTPALRPFVEGELGFRFHDAREDRNGQNRDAWRYALRAGLDVDLGDKVRGTLAAGLEGADYVSANLDDVLGPSVEARLDWSPDAVTRIGVGAQTVFDDSVTAGRSGSLLYRALVDANRDVRENLALFASLAVGYQDFDGAREDTTLVAEAGVAWSLNRNAAVMARVGYTRVESSAENASYDARTASIGLRLRK